MARAAVWLPPERHPYACPTGSGTLMNLFEVAKEISDRLTGIFLRDKRGRRPVYGGIEKVQTDTHWRGSSRYRRLLDPVDAP